MGKTRDPVKKIRDTEGLFHVNMGIIKEKPVCMDLTEAEDIKKRCINQEYKEELHKKKMFMTQINTM